MSRLVAVWPIIGEDLCFEEKVKENLTDLFTHVCGHTPDQTRYGSNSDRFEYDWGVGAFVEADWSRKQGNTAIEHQRFATSTVGLNTATSQYSIPSPFGYTGYLRGMTVMD